MQQVVPLSVIFRDDDGLPCSPPTQLHTRQVCADGSRTFTRNALRSMHDTPRKLTHHEIFWWQPVWAEPELRAQFPAELVDIVLAVRRDQQSFDDALYGMPYSIETIKVVMRAMARHCRAILRMMLAA